MVYTLVTFLDTTSGLRIAEAPANCSVVTDGNDVKVKVAVLGACVRVKNRVVVAEYAWVRSEGNECKVE